MQLVKIKDSEYVRDVSTNAVLNTNKTEIDEFNTKRAKILQDKREREETKMRLAKIEEDMECIKNLIKEMIQLRDNNGN